MCNKSIYKKKILLCTIAGTLIFSHCNSTYANTQPNQIMDKIELDKGKEKTLNNVLIRDNGPGVLATENAVITLKKAIIHTELAALSVSKGGRIHAKDVEINTRYKGLETKNGIINIEDSTVTVQNGGSGGIVIYETPKRDVKDGETITNKVILNNSKLLVKDGAGILGPYDSKAVNEIQLTNSEIRSDVLLRNKTKRKYHDENTLPVSVTLTTDNSIIEGRARTLKINTTVFTLNNDSKWYLKISQEESDIDFNTFNYDLTDIKQRALSTVSVLNLNGSSIIFNAPHVLNKGYYQTLSVGRTAEVYKSRENMVPTVKTAYNATGDAKIYFNTEWSNGLPKEQQKTDRLLIHGNVSGTTTIHFNNLSKGENSKAENSFPLNTRGLSLIQVSGKADENAFKLANGYTTMDGLPYKYILRAYGPTSSHGKANMEQNLLGQVSQESEENTLKDYTQYVISEDTIEGISQNGKDAKNTEKLTPLREKANEEQNLLGENENFWDFRLQSATLDPEEKIRALVPQTASYLIMSNAAFSAGFADVSNQNTLLNIMQTAAFESKKGIFLSSYGNKMMLSSSRSPLEYGYGADVYYAALQAGITLATLEDQNITSNFGLLGIYGKLAFTPKDMEDSEKSTFDKWSLAAYGSAQHNNGVYINALLSYGALKGNITTALIGNTAKVDNAKTWNVSAIVGQKLATGVEELVFEPQAQLVYQRLTFGNLSDIDGFDVDMGTPYQWLVRIGGRLTQSVSTIKKDSAISFYGKLNIMRTFGENDPIKIGNTFHVDSMGTSVEGGLGVNAHLSSNITLRGDVSYQHKLQKAGISGINFSSEIRYRF
ncbi:autotransporter outer membrane beta-barrel domain-containing protein [Bartonella doshiae]|uniref:autotransporter outer membrane beta-barrel domain-containing protein n=1 Tax=Bartonella doshiae TaxID=33044 RepID=UPI001ABBA3B0|nr:autotransporter outer membrane beta-barrel domain-containing protein [Bartonella doshiae]